MNDLRTAAQQALEALEWISDCHVGDDDDAGECASCHQRSYKPHAPDCKKNNAIAALRAALAHQAEPTRSQQMVAAGFKPRDRRLECDECGGKFTAQMLPIHKCAQQAEAVEPVAWMVYTEGGTSAYVTDNPTDLVGAYRALPLYTAPPQRKPLTAQQLDGVIERHVGGSEITDAMYTSMEQFARAVEQASWEKNHG